MQQEVLAGTAVGPDDGDVELDLYQQWPRCCIHLSRGMPNYMCAFLSCVT
jgi:hypothetical protein